jgi:hypothetical protein
MTIRTRVEGRTFTFRRSATLERMEIYFGHFKTRTKRVPLAKKGPGGEVRFAYVLVTEEKGSDVALGAHLVRDACRREALGLDAALVISNDSDLAASRCRRPQQPAPQKKTGGLCHRRQPL